MRYIKILNGQLVEYSGPQMGSAWFEENGWIPYEGWRSLDWLYIDQDGGVAELSEAEYGVLHPAPPKRYNKLRLIEEADERWPLVEAEMTPLEKAKFQAADCLVTGRSDVDEFLARIRLKMPDADEILKRCEI